MIRRKKKRRDITARGLTKKHKRVKPLKFLLSVMNDPKMDQMERIKAALAALPYCHAQKMRKIPREGKGKVGRPPKPVELAENGEPVMQVRKHKLGKKEVKAIEAATATSSGRFKPFSPPRFNGVNGVSH